MFQLNPDVNLFQRSFVNEVRRTDEMERRLDFLEAQIQAEEGEPSSSEGEKQVFSIDYESFSHEPTRAEEISDLEVRS